MTVSLAQGGEGLGAMWGEEKTREYLRLAGFGSVEKHELSHDIQNNWYVVRKIAPRASEVALLDGRGILPRSAFERLGIVRTR